MNEHADYGRPVVESGSSPHRPWHRSPWTWIVLGVVVLPVLGFGAVFAWFMVTDDRFGAKAIGCAEALPHTGLDTLPPTAELVCAESGFQDPIVTIDFTAPQADVDAWLRAELPETELREEGCLEADGCLQISYGEPDAPESGWTLDVKTVDQGDGTVSVAIGAYAM